VIQRFVVDVIEPGAVVDAVCGHGIPTSDQLLEKRVALLAAVGDAGVGGILTFDAQAGVPHHEHEELRLALGEAVVGDGLHALYFGNSAGAMYGAIFLALEPSIYAAAEGVPGALSPEHGRWAPGRRGNFFGPQLRDRIPSLLNAPGITIIDGVAVNPPHFNENKPLRDQPPVTNTVEGAIHIQNAMELHEWGQQSGQSPLPWAGLLREAPLPGVFAKSLLVIFGRGDQNAINPGTTAILHAGNLVDRTVHYRHDLAFTEDSTIPRNPHFFITSPTSPNALVRSIARGVERQIAAFFASNGTVVIHPEPIRFSRCLSWDHYPNA
jgi:hypothetical protein